MLVAHQDDHITHAVIGGKKQMNFGISDDPAFFQILSSALYKDPMLAMIRETICNAWDAHIDSGRTHRPISITLDDDYLIIKDYGNGIPDDMIQPIYGVYGASTKKNDGRQTGGFGLGCKSPFAYTDHFEVTSHHAGIKTIYNMSKSSAAIQGKPGITPIASFSTIESGIIVKIPLNPEKQNYFLSGLIKQVVFNGDIKAIFNNEELPVLGLDNSESGLILINNEVGSDINMNHLCHKGRIFIRYGNVIYPVDKAPEFGVLYDKVHNVLQQYYKCTLIMLAAPDSISITPSRESLTLSDITIQSVKELLTKFLGVFFKNQELMVRHKELVETYVDAASEREGKLSDKLPSSIWRVPGIPDVLDEKILKSTDQFALLEVLIRYSGSRGTLKTKTWFKFITRYLRNLQKKGEIEGGLLHRWIRTAERNLKIFKNPSEYDRLGNGPTFATQWWRKFVLAPLLQEMMKIIPDFNKNNLFFISSRGQNWDEGEKVSEVEIKNHTENLIHLLKCSIVVAHNAKNVNRRLSQTSRTTFDSEGSILKRTYFILEVSSKKGVAEKTIEQLQLIPGVEVIDLTQRLPYEQVIWEERQKKIAKKRAERADGKTVRIPIAKKQKPGLIQFNYILDPTHKMINTRIICESTDPVRIVNPEFVVHVSTGINKRHEFENFDPKIAYAAAILYGNKGAVTNKEDAYKRYKENGAMDIEEYITNKILVDVETSPTLLEYHSTDPEKMCAYTNEKIGWSQAKHLDRFVRMLCKNPALRTLIPNFCTLSDEDQYRWVLWKNLSEITSYKRRNEIKQIEEKIEAIPLKQEIKDFLDELIVNQFLGLIDIDEASTLLLLNENDPVATAKIVSFIQEILK